jgi:TatD DNase family protein
MVRASLGSHPQLAHERESEFPLFEKLLRETRYVCEVGLDGSPRFYKSMEAQERIFTRILSTCREHGGKVLSIHSVRSAIKVMEHLEKLLPPERGKCVLHWFTGSNAEAKRAIDYGCYFSINAQMLDNPRHRSLVASLPLERPLTETDGPFVVRDGKPVRPCDVAATVQTLAALRNMPHEDMSNVILQNLQRLLSLPSEGAVRT